MSSNGPFSLFDCPVFLTPVSYTHLDVYKRQGYTCIAHNAKGYDAHFILRYCVKNTVKPYTIYVGTKLMLLEVEYLGLKVIDSMNFVAGPLSAFPKTFGLKELKKGYFPHFFNTPENQSYVGPIPDKILRR